MEGRTLMAHDEVLKAQLVNEHRSKLLDQYMEKNAGFTEMFKSLFNGAHKLTKPAQIFKQEVADIGQLADTLASVGNKSTSYLRQPVTDLGEQIALAEEMGKRINLIRVNDRLADEASNSIMNSYKLFGGNRQQNPLFLKKESLRELNKGLEHLGPAFEGFTGANALDAVAYHELKKAIGARVNEPGMSEFLEHISGNPKAFESVLKDISAQYAKGMAPEIKAIYPGMDKTRPITLQMSMPLHTHNGAVSVDLTKAMGIDGKDSYASKYRKIRDIYESSTKKMDSMRDEALENLNYAPSGKRDPSMVMESNFEEVKKTMERADKFDKLFGQKIVGLTPAGGAKALDNRMEFTLDDIDSIDKVKAYFRENPYLGDIALDKGTEGGRVAFKKLSDNLVKQVENSVAGLGANASSEQKAAAVRAAVRRTLAEYAKNPHESYYLNAIPFKHVGSDDLKNFGENVMSASHAVGKEKVRLLADAMGIVGLPAVGLGFGGKALYGMATRDEAAKQREKEEAAVVNELNNHSPYLIR